VALLAALALGDTALAEDSARRAAPVDREASAAAPAGGARMRVAIDPETGEFTAEPAPATDPAEGAATHSLQRGSEEVDDLVEEENPAGGFTVHLRRRFGGVARAVAAPSGLEVECDAGESGKPHGAPTESHPAPRAPVQD
jgi:hypothetical protein